VQTIGPGESVEGDVTVEDHLLLLSQVKGGVTVPADTSFEVREPSTAASPWTQEAGSSSMEPVTVGSRTTGEADIYGTVIGGIHGNGQTRVSGGGLIDGVRGRELDWEPTPLTNEAAGEGNILINHALNVGGAGGVTVIGAELVETPMVVEGHQEIRGQRIAGVHVPADAWLTLNGTVHGGLTVDPGGHVVIHGSCVGGLTNDGEVDVFGVVFGGISGSGQTRVDPDATVDLVKGRDLGWDSAASSDA